MVIYKVINTVNGKSYIGQTVRSLGVRKFEHLQMLNSGLNLHFHRALRKYGEENFEWEVIDDTAKTIEELNEKEKHYIKKYDTFCDNGCGYNMTTGGKNALHSKKTLEKLRKAKLGKKPSKKTLEKLRKAKQGEKAPSAKLTNKEVLSIRAEFKESVRGEYLRLAREYSVDINTIRCIILRKTWKHI